MQQERRDVPGRHLLPRQYFFDGRRQLARRLQNHRQPIHPQRRGPIERQRVAILPVAMQHRIQNLPTPRPRTHKHRTRTIAEQDRSVWIERAGFDHRRHFFRANHQHIAKMRGHLRCHRHPEQAAGAGHGHIDRRRAFQTQSRGHFRRRSWKSGAGATAPHDDQPKRSRRDTRSRQAILCRGDRQIDDASLSPGPTALANSGSVFDPIRRALHSRANFHIGHHALRHMHPEAVKICRHRVPVQLARSCR